MTCAFLTLEEVLHIHGEQLRCYGGSDGLRDQGLLESALGAPEASFAGSYLHRDVFEMAAAYAFHIAQNQPFLDGTKRTGLVAALVFLDLNDITVQDPEGRLYDAMIALAERRLDKEGLALLLRELADANH